MNRLIGEIYPKDIYGPFERMELAARAESIAEEYCRKLGIAPVKVRIISGWRPLGRRRRTAAAIFGIIELDDVWIDYFIVDESVAEKALKFLVAQKIARVYFMQKEGPSGYFRITNDVRLAREVALAEEITGMSSKDFNRLLEILWNKAKELRKKVY